jgi:hypothetical protein
MTDRQIAFVPLTELTPDPRNPKAHDTVTITESVDRFGYVEPVVIDGRTGYIVSGHGRLKTLTAMWEDGATPPNGVTVKDDEWLIPVVTGWESGNDMEAAAALIALNRTTELGGWVDDALLCLLKELSDDDAGLDGIGYNDADVEALNDLVKMQTTGMLDLGDLEDFDPGEKHRRTVECPECEHRFRL